MKISKAPLPKCAICHKDVDSISSIQDIGTQEYVFLVKCHGGYEVMRLPTYILHDCKLESGWAFKNKRIDINHCEE